MLIENNLHYIPINYNVFSPNIHKQTSLFNHVIILIIDIVIVIMFIYRNGVIELGLCAKCTAWFHKYQQ